jgi:hypothetical protein
MSQNAVGFAESQLYEQLFPLLLSLRNLRSNEWTQSSLLAECEYDGSRGFHGSLHDGALFFPPHDDGDGEYPFHEDGDDEYPSHDDGDGEYPFHEDDDGEYPPHDDGEYPFHEDGDGEYPFHGDGDGECPFYDDGDGEFPFHDDGVMSSPSHGDGGLSSPPRDDEKFLRVHHLAPLFQFHGWFLHVHGCRPFQFSAIEYVRNIASSELQVLLCLEKFEYSENKNDDHLKTILICNEFHIL